jgi:hypothetical protein
MNYSIAIIEEQNEVLKRHLIRADGQEDLCFALYNISTSHKGLTAVITQVIYPKHGDRNIHGNVSFNAAFYDRVTALALKEKCGICFIHNHPANGWQGMSKDDINAENMLAPRVKATTSLPLVGLTLSQDGIWSGRFWIKEAPKTYVRHFCAQIRVVGKRLDISYYDELLPPVMFGNEFTRTISAWGDKKQSDLSRLRVGIVGLGSVGSIVAEALVRTGIMHISLIDFDIVEAKNLDRLQGIKPTDVGSLKVSAVQRYLQSISIEPQICIEAYPFSIAEDIGLKAALDCDVIFSCVDRPWPRYILNCISYANAIAIIDGGIDASANKTRSNLDQARWKSHAISPGRACLCCLGQYRPEDVALEQSGLLEQPHYIQNLPMDHFANRGENVFAFSLSLAGMEMQQFLSLILQPKGQYCGPKEYHFNSGTIDSDFDFNCKEKCIFPQIIISQGDKINSSLISKHLIAEQSRNQVIDLKIDVQREKAKWDFYYAKTIILKIIDKCKSIF